MLVAVIFLFGLLLVLVSRDPNGPVPSAQTLEARMIPLWQSVSPTPTATQPFATCLYDPALWHVGYRFECTVWNQSLSPVANQGFRRDAVVNAVLVVQTAPPNIAGQYVSVNFGDSTGAHLLEF